MRAQRTCLLVRLAVGTPADYLDDNTLAQPTVKILRAHRLSSHCSWSRLDLTIVQATDVVLVEPGFEFEVAFLQPSCFANDGTIEVDCWRMPTAPEGPLSPSELYEATGRRHKSKPTWDNINDFIQDDLVPGDYTCGGV